MLMPAPARLAFTFFPEADLGRREQALGGIVLPMQTLQSLCRRERAAGPFPAPHCNFINSGSEKPIFIMLIRRAHI